MAKQGKLSSGFSGSTTRGSDGIIKEIDRRMKRLDIFTDDFSPPGTSDAFKGGDQSKPGFTATPHDDTSTADDNSRNHSKKFRPMRRGDDTPQEELDAIDMEEHFMNVGIKKQSDQFPGAKMSKKKLMDSPEEFTKRVEQKLKDKDEHDKAKVEDADKDAEPSPDEHEADDVVQEMSFDDKVEKKMKHLAGIKKHDMGNGVTAYAEPYGDKWGLTMVKNGSKVYSDEGFTSEQEAIAYAKQVMKDKKL